VVVQLPDAGIGALREHVLALARRHVDRVLPARLPERVAIVVRDEHVVPVQVDRLVELLGVDQAQLDGLALADLDGLGVRVGLAVDHERVVAGAIARATLPDGICVTLAVLRRLKARSRAEGLSGGQFEGDGDNACGFIDRGDRGIDLLRTALRAAL